MHRIRPPDSADMQYDQDCGLSEKIEELISREVLFSRMCGITGMLHMVSVDKYTLNCKKILVEYYFNISLCFHKWPCLFLAEIHQCLLGSRPRTPLFFFCG